MANPKEDAAPPAGTTDWARIANAVERLAQHVTATTTVEPRALDGSAQEAATAYSGISQSLRTIFEPAPASRLALK